ncbi:hypothetical protein [uncultured Thiodictyon sp.]|uniref:hypothetical protein n=1 Tax=uncultured Thiodictyon sp. TaxID=1846217 RepID=UPI0025FDAD1C|nr:hypothetical protein [uncultured Thiodictyon sp.]
MSDPITLVTAGLASFAHLNTLVKSFLETRDNAVNLEQVNALNSEIASKYVGYLALQQHISALLAENDELKNANCSF